MNDEQPLRGRAWPHWLVIGLGVLIICAIWAGSWVLIEHYVEPDKRGQFGDMFGAVNALFSGLAFGGVIYAVYLQRKELELQRLELQLSRDELAHQNQVLAQQLRTMQESLNFELTKEAVASEPVFQWIQGSRSAKHVTFRFRNSGGPIHRITVNAPDFSMARVEPCDIIQTNHIGELYLQYGGRGCPEEARFNVRYSNRLGQQHEKAFIFRREGLPGPADEVTNA